MISRLFIPGTTQSQDMVKEPVTVSVQLLKERPTG